MAKIAMKMGVSPQKKYKGNISLSSGEIPEAKNWGIGDKVNLLVEVEITGLRKPDQWEIDEKSCDKNSIKVQSDILSIKSINVSK